MLHFFTKHLILLHKGVFLTKIKSAMAISLVVSPIPYVLEQLTRWTVSNSTYIQFVFGAIIIDYTLGSIIHFFIKKDFSLKKNITGLLTKIGMVVAVGYLFEGVKELTNIDTFLSEYLMMILRLTVFLYPAGSAFMNSSIITKGAFPPIGWITKIKKFEQNLDIETFKKENNERF